MDSYDLSKTKKLKPLALKEYDLILAEGILTGSSVLGGFNEGISDYDYIISPNIKKYLDISYLINEGKIYYSGIDYNEVEEYTSFYAKVNDKKFINLLIMGNDVIYKKWKKATQLMIKIKKIRWMGDKFEDRIIRIKFFEFLKDFYT